LTGHGTRAGAAPDLDPAEIADWLARHPDFLARRPELLHVLTPVESRRGEGVLDFQRFVAGRLQDDLARLRRGHEEFVSASRAGASAQGRVHATVLALLAARSLEHCVEVAIVDLALHVEVDAVVLGFEAGAQARFAAAASGIRTWPRGRIEGWLPPGREALLAGPVVGDPALFAAAAPLVRSQALLRLPAGPLLPAGLLALGARDPARFQPGAGSDALIFLAQALALVLAGWMGR